ncbi:MAG: hypothetical protein V4724_41200 [Pseudomonadota bacterium]
MGWKLSAGTVGKRAAGRREMNAGADVDMWIASYPRRTETGWRMIPSAGKTRSAAIVQARQAQAAWQDVLVALLGND